MRASKEESAPSPGAPKPISFGAALCNTLKSVFGTGLLALPYGFALVGPAPAATISLLLGLYSAFTMHLLARAVELQKQLDDDHLTADATPNAPLLGQGRPSATAGGGGSDPFSQLVRCALGGRIAALSVMMLIAHQILVCAAYLVFAADNLASALNLEHLSSNLSSNLSSFSPSGLVLTMLSQVYILLLTRLRSLDKLGWTSLVGTLSLALVLLAVSANALLRISAGAAGCAHPSPMPSSSALAAFVGLGIFTFAGHTETVAVANALGENRKQYGTVMLLLGAIGVPLILCFASLAERGYGCSTPTNVLLALHSSAAAPLKAAMAASAFCSTPIKMFPAVQACEALLGMESASDAWRSLALRLALALFSLGCAAALPDFGFLCALVGAACNVPIAFVLPPASWGALARRKGLIGPVRVGIISLMILLGIVLCLFTTAKVVLDKIRNA